MSSLNNTLRPSRHRLQKEARAIEAEGVPIYASTNPFVKLTPAPAGPPRRRRAKGPTELRRASATAQRPTRKAKPPASLATKQARTSKLLRHTYSTAQRKEMVRRGECFLDGSHVIHTAEELRWEIRLASEPGASRDALRAHCIRRAAGMGLGDLLPSNWRQDGTVASVQPTPATSPFGPSWNIANADDVLAKVRDVDFGRARGPQEAAIKAWIRQRAAALGVRLPATWILAEPPMFK